MESQGGAAEPDSGSAGGFDVSKHTFKIPVKKIDDPVTLEQFKASLACTELLGFIGALSVAVQKSKMTETETPEV